MKSSEAAQEPQAHVVVVAIAVSIVLAASLLMRLKAPVVAPSDAPLATLSYGGHHAQAQRAAESTWAPARAGLTLRAHDRVRTSDAIGDSAGAHFRIGSGTEVKLSEQTTAELDKTGAQYWLKLSQGRAHVSDASSLNVQFPHGVLKLNGATAIVESWAGQPSKISLRKGKATLAHDGKTTALQAGDVVEVDQQSAPKKATATIALDEPKDSQVLVSADSNFVVALNWTPQHPAILDWQIAKDPAFTQVLERGRSHDGHATARLPVGTYYWRVMDEKGEGSDRGRFTVAQHAGVTLVGPRNGYAAAYWKAPPQIEVEWSSNLGDARDVGHHRVEFATSRDFSNAIRLTGETRARFAPPQPGEWFWRVVSEYPATHVTRYSEIRQLTVERSAVLAAPKLLLPRDESAETAREARYMFSWHAVEEADAYKLFIWPEGAARPAEPTLVTTVNNARISAAKLDLARRRYQWTVVAVAKSGELGGFAKKRSFRVYAAENPVAPKPLAPVHGEQFATTDKMVDVTIRWSKVEGATAYRYLVEKRVGEDKWTKHDEGMVEREQTRAPAQVGSYRWSVSAIDELGRQSRPEAMPEFEIIERQASERLPAPELDVK